MKLYSNAGNSEETLLASHLADYAGATFHGAVQLARPSGIVMEEAASSGNMLAGLRSEE